MDDDTLSINPDRERRKSLGLDPYVLRLPDGDIRVTAESIAFPEMCPRCGAVPANTRVRLKGQGKGSRSISIPYCKRCGWALNFIQYLFAALLLIGMLWMFPHLKVPSTLVLIAIAWGALWAFELLFKLSFKPGISVVAWTRDSIDLCFEDKMYAERLVELNR